jgi:hypothetical protein
MRTMLKRLWRVKAVPLVVVAASLAFAAPALANSWHPITGTCYESGAWFTSSNVRTVSSGGSSIRVQFNYVPSKGMAFRVINYNTGAQLGSTIYTPPLSAQTLASSQPGGRQFVNSFRLQVAGHQDNYSFDGSELY